MPANRLQPFVNDGTVPDYSKIDVRNPAKTPTPTVSNTAPANASAAPKGNTKHVFTGLAEALNSYQNQLVQEKKYSIADIYEFQFNPESMGNANLKKPGSTDRSKTAGKQVTTARDQVDPKTDSVNNNSQNWSVQAGTQVVQLIDQIMRSSSYIYEQALIQVDANTQEPLPSPGTGTGITTWYNVSVQATSLGFDELRRDDAYRLTYVITPYAITKMASEYFPDSRYRGVHKSYSYWFTGQNTQILNFEQTLNGLYKLIVSGLAPGVANSALTTDYRNLGADQYSKTALPTTTQKTGQQTGTYTNTAVDSAADFLYSPTDLKMAKVRIVGDPAWLQQGSVASGIGPEIFSFGPFNQDGTINYDSQQVLFDINWNQPQDYDFSTGVMNVNNQQGLSRQNNTYIATLCKSFFTRGRFEQELEGKLLIEFKKSGQPSATTPVAEARPQETSASTTTADVRPPTTATAFEEGFTLAAGVTSVATGARPDIIGNATRRVKTFVGPNR